MNKIVELRELCVMAEKKWVLSTSLAILLSQEVPATVGTATETMNLGKSQPH